MSSSFAGCNRLVEYQGNLVRVCSPDYIFRDQPYLKVVWGFGLFLILMAVGIGLVYLIRKNVGKSQGVGNKIAMILATLICMGYSIYWLVYGIQSIINYH